MNEIIIKTEFIKLQQLLKLAGIVGPGDIITIRNIGELKILQKQ